MIAFILLIPLLAIALILAALIIFFGLMNIISTGNLAIIAVIILIALPAILLFIYLVAVITLPITVFFRYYPMIFLGKIEIETGKLLEEKGIKLK